MLFKLRYIGDDINNEIIEVQDQDVQKPKDL